MEELTAADIMSSPARSVAPSTTLAEAAEIMLDESIGSLLVVDEDGKLQGIVTDSDFGSSEARVPFSTFKATTLLDRWVGQEGVEKIYEAARRRTVDEIMTAPVHTVQVDTPLRELLDVMFRRDVKHVPVLRGKEPAGVVARHDLLKVIRDRVVD